MKRTTALAAVAITAAATLGFTSCATDPTSQQGSQDLLQVVATTTQLADFAGQVGGPDIRLTGLLAPGSSAHHFDPSPVDLLALGTADVLIVNGAGLDDFMHSAIEASGFSGAVIDASEGVDLELARHITAEQGDAEEHEHAGEEHEHEHGDINPHLWTSVKFAAGMVDEIAEGFGAADPVNIEAYESRAAAYKQKLQTLDSWVAEQFGRVPAEQRVLVTGHDSLLYYLHDYDIAFAGALLPSFEDNAEPSVAEINELIAVIKERGVRAIFVESSLSPKLAQTVAKQTGAQVIDADLLYVDSLGPEGGTVDTYVGSVVHNTRVILGAWGVAPDALPEALGDES